MVIRMFHIILTILKVIGIIIGCILGLLLLILLSILFVPIRYKSEGVFQNEKHVSFRVSWFLHLISFRLRYKDGKLDYGARLLGISVPIEKLLDIGKEKAKSAGRKTSKKAEDITEEDTYEIGRDVEKQVEEQQDIKSEEHEITEKVAEPTEEPKSQQPEEEIGKDQKVSFYKKIKLQIRKIHLKFKNLKYQFLKIYGKIKKALLNIRNIRNFLKDEDTKLVIRFLKEQITELYRHIKPRKFKADIRFGTGDPATTGQILGFFSIFYAYFYNTVKVVPDFENKVFKGSFFLRGRIRVVTLLIIGIRMYRHKQLRNAIISISNKEENNG